MERRKKLKMLKNMKVNVKEEAAKVKYRSKQKIIAGLCTLLILAQRATAPFDMSQVARSVVNEMGMEPMKPPFHFGTKSTIYQTVNAIIEGDGESLDLIMRMLGALGIADNVPERGGRFCSITEEDIIEERVDELLQVNAELRKERDDARAKNADEASAADQGLVDGLRIQSRQLSEELADMRRALDTATRSNQILARERDEARTERREQFEAAEEWRGAAAKLGNMVGKFTRGGFGEAGSMLDDVVVQLRDSLRGESRRRNDLVQASIKAAASADAAAAQAAQSYAMASRGTSDSGSTGLTSSSSGSASSVQSPGGGPLSTRGTRKAARKGNKPPGLPAQGSYASLPLQSARRNPLLEARRSSEPSRETSRPVPNVRWVGGGVPPPSGAGVAGPNVGHGVGGNPSQGGWGGGSGWNMSPVGSQTAGLQRSHQASQGSQAFGLPNFQQSGSGWDDQTVGLPGQPGHHPYCMYGSDTAQQQDTSGWGQALPDPVPSGLQLGGQQARAAGPQGGSEQLNQQNLAQFTNQLTAHNPSEMTRGGVTFGGQAGGYSTAPGNNFAGATPGGNLQQQHAQHYQQLPQCRFGSSGLQQSAARTGNIGREEGTAHGVFDSSTQSYLGQPSHAGSSAQQPLLQPSPQSLAVVRPSAQVGDIRANPHNQPPAHPNVMIHRNDTMSFPSQTHTFSILPSHSHSHPRSTSQHAPSTYTHSHTLALDGQHTITSTVGLSSVSPRLIRSSTDPDTGMESGAPDGQSADPQPPPPPHPPATTTTPPPPPPTGQAHPLQTSTDDILNNNIEVLDLTLTPPRRPFTQYLESDRETSPWSSPRMRTPPNSPPPSSPSTYFSPENPLLTERHHYHPDTPPTPCHLMLRTVHRTPVIPTPDPATLDPSDLRHRLTNRRPFSYSSNPVCNPAVSPNSLAAQALDSFHRHVSFVVNVPDDPNMCIGSNGSNGNGNTSKGNLTGSGSTPGEGCYKEPESSIPAGAEPGSLFYAIAPLNPYPSHGDSPNQACAVLPNAGAVGEDEKHETPGTPPQHSVEDKVKQGGRKPAPPDQVSDMDAEDESKRDVSMPNADAFSG